MSLIRGEGECQKGNLYPSWPRSGVMEIHNLPEVLFIDFRIGLISLSSWSWGMLERLARMTAGVWYISYNKTWIKTLDHTSVLPRWTEEKRKGRDKQFSLLYMKQIMFESYKENKLPGTCNRYIHVPLPSLFLCCPCEAFLPREVLVLARIGGIRACSRKLL